MDQRRRQARRAASETRRRMNGSASDASRRIHEPAQEPTRIATKLADRAQTTAALTEANQRVLNEFMGLSMQTLQASARIFMQMQQSAMEMLRESQAAVLRAQMAWPEIFKDPMRWYQSVCHESMEGARKAFDAVNGTSQAVTESANHLTSAASRMKKAA